MVTRSRIPQVDQHLSIQPDSLLLVGGCEECVETFVLGIFSTVDRAQWANVGSRPFDAPFSNVEVINWGPDPKATDTTEGMVIFVDGFNEVPQVDLDWTVAAREFLRVATENHVTVIVLYQASQGHSSLDPVDLMPSDMVSAFRERCSQEVIFGWRHYSVAMAAIRSLDEKGLVSLEKVVELSGASDAYSS